MVRKFEGLTDTDRRIDAIDGVIDVDGKVFAPFRKISLTYAVQMDEPFRVETLEGDMVGKPGDYLAIGAQGEMYPIDQSVFDESYEPA